MAYITYACFASRRYWPDENELDAAVKRVGGSLHADVALVTDASGLSSLGRGGTLVVIPLSGAVQPLILEAASGRMLTVLYAGYVQGCTDSETERLAMARNAAPTAMDTWCVLKRSEKVRFALDRAELDICLEAAKAAQHVKDAKVILVGDTEPWVISSSRSAADYERLVGSVEKVPQAELVALYERTSDSDAAAFYSRFKGGAAGIEGPADADIKNGARMAHAIVELMKSHNADAMALACFNILSCGTNCCLGVSYVNDMTGMCASCEGDMDSAVTMLLMKKLASGKLWMANPGIHPGSVINFSHCTAPVDMTGCGACSYRLRTHHESGIGVSLEVALPVGERITACRISAAESAMTVNLGRTVGGMHEAACHTQCYVKFDDFKRYIDTSLGCHQVFAFGDIGEAARLAGELLGLTVL